MYLMMTSAEQRRQSVLIGHLCNATPENRELLIRGYLSGSVGEQLTREDAMTVAAILDRVGDRNGSGALKRADFVAAAAVFLVVVTATFPPIIPFVFVDDFLLAMRLSNMIALTMLFAIGVGLDRYVQGGSKLMRWVVPFIGAVLVATTILLGG